MACSIRVLNESIIMTSRTLGVLQTHKMWTWSALVCYHPVGDCRLLRQRIDLVFVVETNKMRRNIRNRFAVLTPRLYVFTHQNYDLVEKYLKTFTSLENSKPTTSSQRLRFTGKSSRVLTHQTLAGNLACPAIFQFRLLKPRDCFTYHQD